VGFFTEKAVHEYEIRIFKSQRSPSIIIAQMYLSDQGAIQAARRMALGRQFEVWRDMECITGFAQPPAAPKTEILATG